MEITSKSVKPRDIVFLMPGVATIPMGGYKVVFEYCNRLVEDGCRVTVLFPTSLLPEEKSILYRVKSFILYFYFLLLKDYRPYNWFVLNTKVKCKLTYSLNEHKTLQADCYIATSAETALYLQRYKVSSNKKFYFIQGYESWGVGEDRLKQTYRFPFTKMVISRWLKQEIEKYGGIAYLIPNGFDFNYFRKEIDIRDRDPYCVAMMYHTDRFKGAEDGLRAIAIAKKKYPSLKACLFGYCDRPQDLSPWIEYYKQPNRRKHNELYNQASIFIGPSHSEGWGLTVGEAMLCGAAVVCTNTGGYLEMANDGQTALVSPVADPGALAANIMRLLENQHLLFDIADRGNAFIQSFTWDNSYEKLKRLIDQKKL